MGAHPAGHGATFETPLRAEAEEIADGFYHAHLSAEVVLDDPLEPREAQRVEHAPEAVQDAVAALAVVRWWRRIVGHPAGAVDPHLDPGVRIAAAHGDVVAVLVPFAAEEAVDVAGGHADDPQEHRHRRGEILAVAAPSLEEEMVERLEAFVGVELERVLV